MKRISYLFSLLFLMAFVVFTSCGDDTPPPAEPTPRELATDNLTGTWTVTSVTRGGTGGTAVDLGTNTPMLTFTGEDGSGTYTATGVSGVMPGTTPAFPTGENWAFGSTTAPFNQIVITPGPVNFNAVSLTENALSFTYTTRDEKSGDDDVVIAVTATKNN